MTQPGPPQGGATRPARPYIGMHFQCCNVYRRLYLNHDQSAFFGHCPKCLRPVRVPVGEGGTNSKFWKAE